MSQNDLKIISALLYFIVFLFNSGVYSQTEYVGVNLAGAEFGENNLLGTYNQHYTYPTRAEVDYFVDKRLIFNPIVAQNFDSNSIYLWYLNTMVQALNGK